METGNKKLNAEDIITFSILDVLLSIFVNFQKWERKGILTHTHTMIKLIPFNFLYVGDFLKFDSLL